MNKPASFQPKRTVARKDSKGRPIAVPTNDLHPDRLTLRRFTWQGSGPTQ